MSANNIICVCVDTPLLTVAVLLEELKEVDNWYILGAYLNVPVYMLNKIQSTHTQDGVERCKLEMLQYWLHTNMTASWKDIARVLEQLDMLTLATRLKFKYLMTSPATTAENGVCVCVCVCIARNSNCIADIYYMLRKRGFTRLNTVAMATVMLPSRQRQCSRVF